MSAFGRETDMEFPMSAILPFTSAFGGKADVLAHLSECPLIARSGHCDAVGWEPSTASEAEFASGSNLTLGILPLLRNPLIQLMSRGTRELDLNH
jgi:hypothetical protein